MLRGVLRLLVLLRLQSFQIQRHIYVILLASANNEVVHHRFGGLEQCHTVQDDGILNDEDGS